MGLMAGLVMSCASAKKSTYNPANKIAPELLKQDVQLMQNILQKKHPSLYWYTTKDSLDFAFQSAITSLTDSLTELQFRNRLWGIVNYVHCGHTSLRFSKKYTNYFTGKTLARFPLNLKAQSDNLLVTGTPAGRPALARGTVITAINGRSSKMVLDSIYQLMGGDGYTLAFKQQLTSFYFPTYYRSAFGIDSVYAIGYIDTLGIAKTTKVNVVRPMTDTAKNGRQVVFTTITRREKANLAKLNQRLLVIDTVNSTATLTINTFSGAGLKPFFKKSFKKIRHLGYQNVVIDLRQNSGGNILTSVKLLQYLSASPFKLADTVAGIDRSLAYRRHIKPSLLYWLSMHLTGRKRADGRIHFAWFEKHHYRVKNRLHFNGQVYLVTSGFTFSAASMVVSVLQGQPHVTVVGEETGGGSYGNTAVHLAEVTLPNSKIRMVLPLYRIVYSKDRIKNGRGFFPDIQVAPTSSSISQGVDIKMEKVKQLIQQKNKADK